MNEEAKQRVAAIVGRPNVGKSTLFNRLAGRRVSIVHPESGVTRDRLVREVQWKGAEFTLVDTGGMIGFGVEHAVDAIEAGVRQQVDAALAEAAAAILVVDATTGILPLDEEVAAYVRRLPCATVVAANKADNTQVEEQCGEFGKLGFPVFPISATHGRGLDALMAAVLAALPASAAEKRRPALRIAVVGRPNVGKSSFVNRLLRQDRVIVSEVAGTTRDSVDIPFDIGKGDNARHCLLVDTAGLRYKHKVDTAVEHYSSKRAEGSIEDADVVVLMLEATLGPTRQDKEIAAMIRAHAKGCVLVMNKWDLAPETQRTCGPLIQRMMPFLSYCPLVFVSAKDGFNIRRSLEAIEHVARQIRAVMPTGALNRTISDAFAHVQPPALKGRRLKIFYATQTGTAPLRVRLFVNDPNLAPDAYREYLVHALRRRFGLEGAPIVLHFTPRATNRGAGEGGASRGSRGAGRANGDTGPRSRHGKRTAPGSHAG